MVNIRLPMVILMTMLLFIVMAVGIAYAMPSDDSGGVVVQGISEGQLIDAGSATVSFADTSCSFEGAGINFHWTPKIELNSKTVDIDHLNPTSNETTILWGDSNAYVEYTYGTDSVKENIKLYSPVKKLSYAYTLSTCATITKEGDQLIISSGSDDECLQVQKPYAIDANGVRYDLDYSVDALTQSITLVGDLSGATYPIVVDPTVTIEIGSQAGETNTLEATKSMFRDQNGTLYAIAGGVWYVYTYHSINNGATWISDPSLTVPRVLNDVVSGVVNKSGYYNLFYTSQGNPEVVWAFAKVGSAWSTVNLTNDAIPEASVSSTIDANDNIWVFYAQKQAGQNATIAQMFNGTGWSAPTTIFTSNNTTTNIDYPYSISSTIDSGNYPRVSITNYTQVWYVYKNDSGWQTPELISKANTGTLGQTYDTSIILNSSDTPFVVWCGYRYGAYAGSYSKIYISYKNNGIWSSPLNILDDPISTNNYGDVGIDLNDNIYIYSTAIGHGTYTAKYNPIYRILYPNLTLSNIIEINNSNIDQRGIYALYGNNPYKSGIPILGTACFVASSSSYYMYYFNSTDLIYELNQFNNTNTNVLENTGTVIINITHQGTGICSVNYTTSDGTATAGSNYTASSGKVTFNATDTSKTITIPIINQPYCDIDRFFYVNLSNPFNCTLGANASIQVTIQNTNPPGISIGAATYSVREDAGSISIPIATNWTNLSAMSINYTTVDGNAIAGTDYTATSGTFNVAPNASIGQQGTITIPIIHRLLYQGNRSFNVTLSNAVVGQVGIPSSTNITIVDVENTPPVISTFVGSPTYGTTGTTVVFTPTISGVVDHYEWSFGDGIDSVFYSPSHTYTVANNYDVTLTVSNNGGSTTLIRAAYIIISNPPYITPTPIVWPPTPTPFNWSQVTPLPTFQWPTGTVTPAPNGTAYANGITGGTANKSKTLTLFNDNIFTDILNFTFPNNTDNIQPDMAIYSITKPFYAQGVGAWWIVIVLLTMAGIYWLSHNGSPFLIIILMMLGNAVLWAFLPLDWQATITAMAVFSLALMIVSALRGRG